MKRYLGMLAVLIALFAANASSSTPQPSSALPSAKAPAAPWLLAQDRRMPTCSLDNREVPVGSSSCREGRLWICQPGGWVSTGKEC